MSNLRKIQYFYLFFSNRVAIKTTERCYPGLNRIQVIYPEKKKNLYLLCWKRWNLCFRI